MVSIPSFHHIFSVFSSNWPFSSFSFWFFFSFLFCSLSIFVFQVYRPQLFIYFLGCIVIVIIEKSKIFFQWKLSFQSCHEQRMTTNKNRFFATIVSFLMSAIDAPMHPNINYYVVFLPSYFCYSRSKGEVEKTGTDPENTTKKIKWQITLCFFGFFRRFTLCSLFVRVQCTCVLLCMKKANKSNENDSTCNAVYTFISNFSILLWKVENERVCEK